MFFVVSPPPLSWGRVGLVNRLQRGFCTENEAGQSGATEPGMCGMSSGRSRAISITQPAIKATRAQSPGNWLKATQTQGFLPRCRSRFPTDVCGLPKEPRQTAFAPRAATPSLGLVTALYVSLTPWQPGAWSSGLAAKLQRESLWLMCHVQKVFPDWSLAHCDSNRVSGKQAVRLCTAVLALMR